MAVAEAVAASVVVIIIKVKWLDYGCDGAPASLAGTKKVEKGESSESNYKIFMTKPNSNLEGVLIQIRDLSTLLSENKGPLLVVRISLDDFDGLSF